MESKIVVRGLKGKAWNKEKVKDAFLPFGPIVDITLPKEGIAMIAYKFASDAEEAIDNMDGFEFEGVYLNVEQAKAKGEVRLNDTKPIWAKNKPQEDAMMEEEEAE